jgi:hypothetical protein
MTANQLHHLAKLAAEAADYFARTDSSQARTPQQAANAATDWRRRPSRPRGSGSAAPPSPLSRPP